MYLFIYACTCTLDFFLAYNNARCSVFCLLAYVIYNKKRYDSELPYQRPDLIEVIEIEIDLTTLTNVHTGFYISVRKYLDC